MTGPNTLKRRALVVLAAAACAVPATPRPGRADAATPRPARPNAATPRPARPNADGIVRLGILPFGSVQWIADVITHHGMDRARGFVLQTAPLADAAAGKVALLGGAVDVAFSDWPFVAAQRTHGGRLCFASAGSSSLGGIMVPAAAPIHALADLKGLRLGVAGGGADKSWLLVQAAARRQGLDLARAARLSFGAPPLLEAMQLHRDLDAVLTFWNFAARLEARGLREAISVGDCARVLGLAERPVLTGYVFDDRWAATHRAEIDGFLAAVQAAVDLLASSAEEWQRIRPLMAAPDDRLFGALRTRFIAGRRAISAAALEAQAGRIEALIGDKGAGPLPPGMFWHAADAL